MIDPTSNAVDTSAITVQVLFFSVLRERVGRGELEVSIDYGSRASELLDKLFTTYPEIGAFRDIIRVAINQIYVDVSADLTDGDEVALITPVSGG